MRTEKYGAPINIINNLACKFIYLLLLGNEKQYARTWVVECQVD